MLNVSAPDNLLRKVHVRLGLGVDIQTFSDGTVEIRWKRDYGEGYGWSDERWATERSLEAALNAVLKYEDAADLRERSL